MEPADGDDASDAPGPVPAPDASRDEPRGSAGSDGGRRRFLRAVAALGGLAGATAVWRADGAPRATGGTETVVYGHVRPDPSDPGSLAPRTTTVPAAWVADVRRGFAARDRLARFGLAGLWSLAVVPGGVGGEPTTLSVGVADESVGRRVAELVGDVDVVETVVGRRSPANDPGDAPDPDRWVDAVDDRAVPGGVACAASGSLGSLAPALHDARGNAFFATSNHLYGAGGTKRLAHRGEPLAVVSTRDRAAIGRVRRGHPNEDLVRVRPRDGYVPRPRIAGPGSPTVAGQFTRMGLAVLKARGRRLRKVGAVSGLTTGEIQGVDGVTCYVGDVCKDGQLLWGDERAITDGDSGSVTYHPDPAGPGDRVLVAGVNNGRTWWPGADYAWGTAAYHLRERLGYRF